MKAVIFDKRSEYVRMFCMKEEDYLASSILQGPGLLCCSGFGFFNAPSTARLAINAIAAPKVSSGSTR